jgi:hypothetical protein
VKAQYITAALVASAIFWLLPASHVQAPTTPKVVIEVRQASMVISCAEKVEACKTRKRMTKVTENSKDVRK